MGNENRQNIKINYKHNDSTTLEVFYTWNTKSELKLLTNRIDFDGNSYCIFDPAEDSYTFSFSLFPYVRLFLFISFMLFWFCCWTTKSTLQINSN